MGDPVTTSLALKAGSSVAGGIGAYSAAKAQQQDAEANAFIGRTRAIQTSTAAATSLSDEIATFRATLGSNGQPLNVGTFDLMRELRRIRSSERAVEVGNRMQESYGYRRQAQAYGTAAKVGLFTGVLGATPSLFDLYQYKGGA